MGRRMNLKRKIQAENQLKRIRTLKDKKLKQMINLMTKKQKMKKF